MVNSKVKSLVEKERADLLQNEDSVEEAVILRTGRASTVAQGLHVLGKPTDAIEWFSALSDEWALHGEEIWEAKFEERRKKKAESHPFHEYRMSLLTGLLGTIELEDAARTAYDRVTEPFVEDLELREKAYQIDVVGLLSCYLLDEPGYESFAQSLREHVDQNGGADVQARYLSYTQAIEGIAAGNAKAVREGISGLLEFHEEFIVGARDADAVDEAFALDAAAMLVLARREGMDIEVESEYLPEELSVEQYYPVG